MLGACRGAPARNQSPRQKTRPVAPSSTPGLLGFAPVLRRSSLLLVLCAQPAGDVARVERLSTSDRSNSRSTAVRTRAKRHSSQKCPTEIDLCQRRCSEARCHPQRVKCRRRYVGAPHSTLHSAQKYFFCMTAQLSRRGQTRADEMDANRKKTKGLRGEWQGYGNVSLS